MGIVQPYFTEDCSRDDRRGDHCVSDNTTWSGFKDFIMSSAHSFTEGSDHEYFPTGSTFLNTKTPDQWSVWLTSNFPEMSLSERNKIIDFATMENKTRVRIENDDQRYHEYKKGEEGYIDGYVRGGDDSPYAVVVIDARIVMISLTCLKVI
jgi:hypothetical protein